MANEIDIRESDSNGESDNNRDLLLFYKTNINN